MNKRRTANLGSGRVDYLRSPDRMRNSQNLATRGRKQGGWHREVLAWLLPERQRISECRSVIRAAERGETKIVTAAHTLTEVIHLKGQPHLSQEHEERIRRFFKRSFIVVRGITRFVAEDARELIWKHGVKPKDALHVAAAIRARISLFETFDDDLIALNGKLGPAMRVIHPHEREELELWDVTRTDIKDEPSESDQPSSKTSAKN
jgi:predicted nucleic acid-binding protein